MPEALWSGKHRGLFLALGGAISLAWAASWSASAWAASPRGADCAPEPIGEGRIAAVIDARTLRLDDGRVIRLAGLAPLKGAEAENAAAILSSLAIGRAASLHGGSDAPDRYGRQQAWAFLDDDASSLQEQLTAVGGGVRDISVTPIECRRGLESAENTARAGRMGLWSATKFAKRAESPDDLLPEIGHFSVVDGRVGTVRQTGGMTYLNFGRRWLDGFSVLVPGRASAAFETTGLRIRGFEGLKALEGHRLRVRGYVIRRGGPRIEVTSPDQIEVIGDDAVTATGTRD